MHLLKKEWRYENFQWLYRPMVQELTAPSTLPHPLTNNLGLFKWPYLEFSDNSVLRATNDSIRSSEATALSNLCQNHNQIMFSV